MVSKKRRVVVESEISFRVDLSRWLDGYEPYTDEELRIIKQMGGLVLESYSRMAISIYRKSQSMEALAGGGKLSNSEQSLMVRFGGERKEVLGRAGVGLERKGRLLNNLKGNGEDLI